jgi:hypothetical protein
MPYVKGFLQIVSPGAPDQGLPGSPPSVWPPPAYPDQGLPGEPVYPDQGLPPGSPGIPGHLPSVPPPGLWPPLTPSHPIQPAPPGTPPGAIWPPPAAPDQGLPGAPPVVGGGPMPPPPAPDQGLPGSGVPGKFWIVAGIPGVGWRYVCVDPSLVAPGHPIAPTPGPKK